MSETADARGTFWRGVRFSIVGSTAACVYFLLLYVLVEWGALPVMVATAIAYVIVVLENYVLHRFWTFGSNERHGVAIPKFIAVNITGFFINWGIMYCCVSILSFNYLFSQLIAIVAIVAWNFLAGLPWVFGVAGTHRTQ